MLRTPAEHLAVEVAELIEELSKPSAYPDPADAVSVCQTHISVVFLVGNFAYKIKKPVSFGFVDFSSLARRRRFCEDEVRLNRRLAPSVYLGVVPVTRSGSHLVMEGLGEPVEWAVKMVRLPESATLGERLRRGEIGSDQITLLAQRIATFHGNADGSEHISAFGRFDTVAGNICENLSQSAQQVATTISPSVLHRLQALTEKSLEEFRPLIEARANQGAPRDTHGDLRLDHVYLFPERKPPDDIVIIDCIEFSDRFRFADPVCDMAFLVMDLAYAGRGDLARLFVDAYFRARGDQKGQRLLGLYVAYRAAVRAKVEALKLAETEVPQGERVESLRRAQGHWLLSLGALEVPSHKPCLVLVGGLPGTGKSTLAKSLGEMASFSVIRSDVVRKELHTGDASPPCVPPFQGGGAGRDENLYAPESNDRTYAECLRRAEQHWFEGRRVVVDASFREDHQRQRFLEAARRWAVPAVFLRCTANPSIVRTRLANRQGDVSDADWSVYEKLTPLWEEFSSPVQRVVREISTDQGSEKALKHALGALQEFGLWA